MAVYLSVLHLRTLALIALVAAIMIGLGQTKNAAAAYETGTYQIRSPLDYTQWVTSPPRYHDGSICPSTYWDSPDFDNTSVCRAANVPAGGDTPDWAIDVDADQSDDVYIDVNPLSQEGFPAGSTYRVVAGDVYQWDSSSNGQYQYFGIHTWNPNTSGWENYAWARIGHIDNFVYPTAGTVIIPSTTGHHYAIVAKVAPQGSWGTHVHMDFYNYSGWSRAYDWDGPSNANDTILGPACLTGGGSASDCNTQLTNTEGVGYIGGSSSFFTEIDNPYYVGF
jgi:hypothetical protein